MLHQKRPNLQQAEEVVSLTTKIYLRIIRPYYLSNNLDLKKHYS